MGTRYPSLTIAIPFVRNVAYVRRTLDSIFAQTSDDWTALLIDNSNDSAEREAVSKLCESYDPSRLRYFAATTHVGANDNFNRYFELAHTDLIATVHSDDEVRPTYSAEITDLARRHPSAAVLFVAAAIIDERSEALFSFVDFSKRFLTPRGRGDIVLCGEPALRSLMRGNWINGAAVCFRRSAMGELRWDPAYPMVSDLDLWSRILFSGRSIVGSRTPPVYAYRRHQYQTTARLTDNFSRFYEEANIHDVIAERAVSREWHSVARVARKKTIIQLHVAFLALADICRGSFSGALKKLELMWSIGRSRI